MKEIPLNTIRKCKNSGKYIALVDDEDYDYLMKWKWYCDGYGNYKYASTSMWINRKEVKVRMHRLLLDVPVNMVTDHIDHNGLNNQRSNLRICTKSENDRNKLPRGESKYLGVSKTRYKYKGRVFEHWRAAIKNNGKYMFLGTHKTEEEAAHAYNVAAKKYHGEFANLNKTDDGKEI